MEPPVELDPLLPLIRSLGRSLPLQNPVSVYPHRGRKSSAGVLFLFCLLLFLLFFFFLIPQGVRGIGI